MLHCKQFQHCIRVTHFLSLYLWSLISIKIIVNIFEVEMETTIAIKQCYTKTLVFLFHLQLLTNNSHPFQNHINVNFNITPEWKERLRLKTSVTLMNTTHQPQSLASVAQCNYFDYSRRSTNCNYRTMAKSIDPQPCPVNHDLCPALNEEGVYWSLPLGSWSVGAW